MPLPDVIEIVPLTTQVHADVTVPGSKSITNRALILAALSEGRSTLQGALWSEDTQAMTDCLRVLGFDVRIDRDPGELCNRQIHVDGLGGAIPRAGTFEKPLDLFVGNAGTAARFLSALVCLGRGVYRLHGVPRMHERPQGALFKALRDLGYRIDSSNDKLPAIIHGTGPRSGACRVDVEESSQFASALLLCFQRGNWTVSIEHINADELPYVRMTSQLLDVFPKRGGEFAIEPDASSGSYFWGAGSLLGPDSCVTVKGWPDSGWQIDAEFPRFLPLPPAISREGGLGDSIMTAIVLAPFAERETRFTELGRLRLQECERVVALRTELTKCGAHVVEEGDTLRVTPSQLHGAEIETYDDHRMAMCFATLGLKVPGIRIKNPSCVKKTFPDFYQKLVEPQPAGLGAVILDGRTGAILTPERLFAE